MDDVGDRQRECGEERETNKMQIILYLLSNFYPNMFLASLCPSSGEQDSVLPHMVFCTGCADCGCVELCALCSPDDGHNDARNMFR